MMRVLRIDIYYAGHWPLRALQPLTCYYFHSLELIFFLGEENKVHSTILRSNADECYVIFTIFISE
jgi:hypothetical protein